jgi:hypothetical protein
MQVTIQMRLKEATAYQIGQTGIPALQQVLAIIKDLGGELKPMHPGASHPLMVPFFTVEVPDLIVAKQLIRRLLDCSLIEAAYLTARPELP